MASLGALLQHLRSKCPPAQRATFERLLDGPAESLALLINDRMVNMPLDVVPPLLRELNSDIQWARTNVRALPAHCLRTLPPYTCVPTAAAVARAGRAPCTLCVHAPSVRITLLGRGRGNSG